MTTVQTSAGQGGDRYVVTTLASRPDLLPTVAEWIWRQWWHDRGCTLEQTAAAFESNATVGPPQTFVLLDDGVPIGTASLVRQDLEERPDLTPWLAAVLVIPEARGQGAVSHLLATFDAACRAAGIGTAWLYTSFAERIYTRHGWTLVEMVNRPGKRTVSLMRRDFAAPPATPPAPPP